MGEGGGRGDLSRTYSGGAVSSPGFETEHYLPPSQDETTHAVNHVIEAYVGQLDPPTRQVRELGEAKEAIQSSLSRELSVEGVNVVGSVAKRTQIDRPTGNDIDVEFVLSRDRHGDWLTQTNGPRNCLTKVRETLSTDPRFSNIDLSVDRNTVTAQFGRSRVDVIPAFRHPDGGVLIPDTSGGQKWIRTNPRLSKRILEEKDHRWGGQVTQTVRIAKAWSDRHRGPSSVHVEAMVQDYFDHKPQNGDNSSRTNVLEFFTRLPWYFQNYSYEPTYHQRVDAYLTPEERTRMIAKAERTAAKVRKAKTAARRANNADAAAEAFREVLDG